MSDIEERLRRAEMEIIALRALLPRVMFLALSPPETRGDGLSDEDAEAMGDAINEMAETDDEAQFMKRRLIEMLREARTLVHARTEQTLSAREAQTEVTKPAAPKLRLVEDPDENPP